MTRKRDTNTLLKQTAGIARLGFLVIAYCGSVTASETADSEREARGFVRATQSATISSETLARITKMPFRSGEYFKKGDTLVAFDCAAYEAELASRDASLEVERERYANQVNLQKLDAASDFDVAIAAAEKRRAEAQVRVAQVAVGRCRIRAPYNGVVSEQLANEHEAVGPQAELLKILASGAPEVEVVIPSNWLAWMGVDSQFSFTLDETGETYAATVRRIDPAIDATSQTIRAIGTFSDAPRAAVVVGMSGTARFDSNSGTATQ